MQIDAGVWIVTLAALLSVFAFDFVVAARRPHAVSMKEAGLWTALYVSLAVLFGLYIAADYGGDFAGQFYAGWLTEYSLSVDNLFVFVIIMSRFRVPKENQQFVLLVGIAIALVMRAGFIAIGAAAIARFSWVFYVFGAFLVYTAYTLATHSAEESEEFRENAIIGWVKKSLSTTDDYDGNRFRTVIDGRRLFTPMLIVMVAIGTTDLLFALDSIPAIFGLTQEPYLVFTANAFALMGLRQLYFLLGGLLDRLVFLSIGLAVILGFIGVKLIFEALHTNTLPFINGGEPVEWAPEIPVTISLGVIVAVLAVTTVTSLLHTRRQAGSA
ncbi:MAG TPA: TerC family protein [Actinomycetes bacterium]|nr:TerC family protein [Actinomycetes bacterium]